MAGTWHVLSKRRMNQQSLSTKGLQSWLPICTHTHTHIRIWKKEMRSDASQIKRSEAKRDSSFSAGVVRRGWKKLHCGHRVQRKTCIYCTAAPRASEIWGSAHTLQSCLLHLDSLQNSQSLRCKVTIYRSDSRRTEVKSWSVKLQPTSKFVFQQDYIGFMDKNSASYQPRVKNLCPSYL